MSKTNLPSSHNHNFRHPSSHITPLLPVHSPSLLSPLSTGPFEASSYRVQMPSPKGSSRSAQTFRVSEHALAFWVSRTNFHISRWKRSKCRSISVLHGPYYIRHAHPSSSAIRFLSSFEVWMIRVEDAELGSFMPICGGRTFHSIPFSLFPSALLFSLFIAYTRFTSHCFAKVITS